jgi:osmotically inducible protein OsmC
MNKRTSTAVWHGSGKEGSGHLSTPSGVLKEQQYTWASRFSDQVGTNPEELIAAAHAGCFSMKLSFVLGETGHTAESIETSCSITIDSGNISNSHLVVKAKVPGMNNAEFQKAAENAKANCPVSKLLKAEVTMEAELAS